MKKINVLVVLFTASFAFFSCSSNEEALSLNESKGSLLGEITVKRDANGAYSLDFDVTKNTKVDKVVGQKGNFSQFYLYS